MYNSILGTIRTRASILEDGMMIAKVAWAGFVRGHLERVIEDMTEDEMLAFELATGPYLNSQDNTMVK